jgi:hypothetical protein
VSLIEEMARAICDALHDGDCGQSHTGTDLEQAARAAAAVVAKRLRDAWEAGSPMGARIHALLDELEAP